MLSFNFCCIDGQFDKLQQSRAPSLKVQTYLNQIEFIVVIFDTKYCHFHDCHILDNATKHCLANGSWTGPTNYLECLCMVSSCHHCPNRHYCHITFNTIIGPGAWSAHVIIVLLPFLSLPLISCSLLRSIDVTVILAIAICHYHLSLSSSLSLSLLSFLITIIIPGKR